MNALRLRRARNFRKLFSLLMERSLGGSPYSGVQIEFLVPAPTKASKPASKLPLRSPYQPINRCADFHILV